MEHTPTPWKVEYDGDSRPIITTAIPGKFLTLDLLYEGQGGAYASEVEDAMYVVKAVNSHEALVKALRELHADQIAEWGTGNHEVQVIATLLAKLEGMKR